ncbi:hypothetical protein DFH09DRAFT_1404956 [Mycena vulgaris]|nr:hypothetical protein DFH09DRAFT_1404956 [Mycena vulgaris]
MSLSDVVNFALAATQLDADFIGVTALLRPQDWTATPSRFRSPQRTCTSALHASPHAPVIHSVYAGPQLQYAPHLHLISAVHEEPRDREGQGVARYYVYAAPPSDGGDVECPPPSPTRATPAPTAPHVPRDAQHSPRAAVPSRQRESSSSPDPRTLPLRTSSSDDDDNGTEQHDRANTSVAFRRHYPTPTRAPRAEPRSPALSSSILRGPSASTHVPSATRSTAAPLRQRKCGSAEILLIVLCPPSASARRGRRNRHHRGHTTLPASPLRTRAPRALSSGTLALACHRRRRRIRSYLVLRPPHSSRPLLLLIMRVRLSSHHVTTKLALAIVPTA